MSEEISPFVFQESDAVPVTPAAVSRKPAPALHWCELTEKSFLGAIAASEGAVLDFLTPEDDHFFDFRNRRAFQSMLKLWRAGVKLNYDVVAADLGPDLEAAGGFLRLSDIFAYPTAANSQHLFDELEGKLAVRRSLSLGQWIIGQCNQWPDGEELVNEIQRRSGELSVERGEENLLKSASDRMRVRLDDIDSGKQIIGLQTPIEAWNTMFGGLVEASLYGLAGRPGLGKTAMMEQIALYLAAREQPVLVFERDMSPQTFLERVACRGAGIPYWRYVRGIISRTQTQEVRECLNDIEKLPVHLLSPIGLTADRMCSTVKRMKRSKGIRAVFLDHIQALRVGRDIREGLTQASLTIRQSVTDTGIPHVILAHLNRKGADGRPTPEDIKEFDQLYGDCDGLALLWTEAKKENAKKEQKITVKFYGAKNRNGPPGETDMLFDGELMQFLNIAKDR